MCETLHGKVVLGPQLGGRFGFFFSFCSGEGQGSPRRPGRGGPLFIENPKRRGLPGERRGGGERPEGCLRKIWGGGANSGVAPANQTKERGQNKKFMNFAHFCEFWCFSLGKKSTIHIELLFRNASAKSS